MGTFISVSYGSERGEKQIVYPQIAPLIPPKQKITFGKDKFQLETQYPSTSTTINDIKQAVANYYFQVNLEALNTGKHSIPIIRARRIAIYLSKELTDVPLSEIARIFNKSNRVEFRNDIRWIEKRMNDKEKWMLDANLLLHQLHKII